MGKIVKYCSSCDEGFAEKFGFCPDCGASLQAFEMNPVENEVAHEAEAVELAAEPIVVDTELDATPTEVVEPEVPAPVFLQAEEEVAEEIEEPAEEVRYEPVAAPAFYQTSAMYADESRDVVSEATSWDYTHADDGGYYITVIEEKNTKQRNTLLLGATVLMLVLTVGGWGVSLFQKALDIAAIGNEGSLAYLGVDVPMPVEDEPQKKDKENAGGGGGGGKEDPEPVNQGDGSGSGSRGPAPPPVTKVTTPYRIISKPRPGYTDAARANQVTGSVLLKVTLLASGQVGSIVPIRRLPDGLTEQAIAAARQIRFEPKKVNGVPQSITVTIDYGFTIY
jgi:TonB family protein